MTDGDNQMALCTFALLFMNWVLKLTLLFALWQGKWVHSLLRKGQRQHAYRGLVEKVEMLGYNN